MSKKNILFVITKLELGGAQLQLLDLVRHLDRNRFRPFLLSCQAGVLVSDAQNIPHLIFFLSCWLDRPIHLWKDLLAFFELYQCMRRNRIDVVHTHSSKAGILGRLAAFCAGVPCVVHTVHGWPFHAFQSKIGYLFSVCMERFCAGFSHRIVVVCHADQQRGVRERITSVLKFRRIPYALVPRDGAAACPDVVRKQRNSNPQEFLVTCVSCMKPQKSLDDFLACAKQVCEDLPTVKFLLIGDGQLREHLEQGIVQRGLAQRVVLAGWRRDVRDILASSDVFLLTSLWEGLPIAVLEAMAAGVPVVATDTGGVGEVIRQGETGFLAPCRDINSLSGYVLRLLRDAELRERMGSEARAAMRGWTTPQQLAAAYQQVFEEVLISTK